MSENFDLNQNHYNYYKNDTIPLVFIHGVGLNNEMWQPQINGLNNFSIIAYDILGHGKTPINKEKLLLKDFSDQLISILDFLKLTKINLVGFSLGSLIALDFASNFQEKLNKLVLIGTTYQRSESERALVLDRFNQAKLNKPISKQALKRWFSDGYLKKNPSTYDQFIKILSKSPEDHQSFLKAYELFANHKDNIELIQKIRTKTLVMTGSNDSGSTPIMSKELVKDLPNSSYMEIKNGKHLCSIECADDVNIKIRNFINN
tara:strand:+ start:111 stop:893 length:783 start_codon:yes stop_codon:yes gene_type:complete